MPARKGEMLSKFQWGPTYGICWKQNPNWGNVVFVWLFCMTTVVSRWEKNISFNSGSGCRIQGRTCAWGWSAGWDLQTALGLVLDLPKNITVHCTFSSQVVTYPWPKIGSSYNRRTLPGTGCATQTVMATPLQGYNGIASTCASQRLMWQGGFPGESCHQSVGVGCHLACSYHLLGTA